MNKFTRVLGTTLAGAALVGGSATAASAHGDHHGDRHGKYGFGHSSDDVSRHGAYSPQRCEHRFDGFTRHHEDGVGSFNVGPSFNGRWFHHFRGHHHHWTFEERRSAVVDRLTRADERLTALIGYLADRAATDPDGWESEALPYLQAQQDRLETLIDAVKAATSPAELRAAFKAAFAQPTPTPTPTPTPMPSSGV